MKKISICVHNWYIYNRNHDNCDRNQKKSGSVWEGVQLYQKVQIMIRKVKYMLAN